MDLTEHERRNVETCRKVLTRVWGKGELDICDEVFLPDFVRYDLGSGDAVGPQDYKDLVAMTRRAFPDMVVHIEGLTPRDNIVFFRTRMEGTHTGDFNGLPPTGARLNAQTLAEVHFREDGWATKAWVVSDYMSVVKAIMGAMPLWKLALNGPKMMKAMK